MFSMVEEKSTKNMRIKNLESLATVDFNSFTLGKLLTEIFEQGKRRGQCGGVSAWHILRQNETRDIAEAVQAEIFRRFTELEQRTQEAGQKLRESEANARRRIDQ